MLWGHRKAGLMIPAENLAAPCAAAERAQPQEKNCPPSAGRTRASTNEKTEGDVQVSLRPSNQLENFSLPGAKFRVGPAPWTTAEDYSFPTWQE